VPAVVTKTALDGLESLFQSAGSAPAGAARSESATSE
jgi:hypothetical protein